jgi:hypothetical protein
VIEIIYAVGGLSVFAVLVWAVRSIKRWGASDYKRNDAEKKLKGVRDAKKIKDRLAIDSDYRKRVRDKFR